MKIKEPFNKDEVFFTSDTHFFHDNIIKYCNRPFKDANEMNDAIITLWNKTIPKDGIVFHLGDVAMNHTKSNTNDLLNQLNGTIYLMIGNHDRHALRKHPRFQLVSDLLEIQVEDDELTYGMQHVVMCHYPMLAWNGSHKGSWQLFGHVHGGLSNKGNLSVKPTQLDVGVDCNKFAPFTWMNVKEQITLQSLK